MAVTLLDVVKRVSRSVGLDPTITAFSDDNETNDLVQYVNEAYEDLVMALPPECPYLKSSGTITLVAGTRLYTPNTNAQPQSYYEWSFTNTTTESPLEFATRDYLEQLDSEYQTASGTPSHVYVEGSQLGFYPVPDTAVTVTYDYGIAVGTRLSATTDTFVLPDRWIRFVERQAQATYETNKGYASAEGTQFKALEMKDSILVEAWEANPTYLTNEGIT